MHPVLFELRPFTIYTYGVLVAAGFLVGLWYAHSHAARAALSPRKVSSPRAPQILFEISHDWRRTRQEHA